MKYLFLGPQSADDVLSPHVYEPGFMLWWFGECRHGSLEGNEMSGNMLVVNQIQSGSYGKMACLKVLGRSSHWGAASEVHGQ